MTFLMACSEVPYGVCEYEIVGGMRGEPVEVTRVYGTAHSGQRRDRAGRIRRSLERLTEGPFGEWTGYYASDMRPEPVLDIKAVYYRNNPILLGCAPQRPPDELPLPCGDPLRVAAGEHTKAGVPGVTVLGA